MRTPEMRDRSARIEGIVQRVDTVNRELTLVAEGATFVIDVPSDCPILLRGERVKMRMIQPRDPVRVTYAEGRDPRAACAVEVQPNSPPLAAW
jgi:hypothetical protein